MFTDRQLSIKFNRIAEIDAQMEELKNTETFKKMEALKAERDALKNEFINQYGMKAIIPHKGRYLELRYTAKESIQGDRFRALLRDLPDIAKAYGTQTINKYMAFITEEKALKKSATASNE